MPIRQVNIEEFLKLSNQFPVFDVRSPSEFAKAHIPGAFSLPLFTDEQRKVIGTAYKQQSREAAVNIGLNYFSDRMKIIPVEVANLLNDFLKNDKAPVSGATLKANGILVHCWRGGMRSGAVAWLLSLYGYPVFVLKGGYKSFRNFALQQFEHKYTVNVLGGYTGSGKTEILTELKRRGKQVIDLEHLANHKGSSFGGLGHGAQPSQEMFENMLSYELWALRTATEMDNANRDAYSKIQQPEIWVEDESRNIGTVNIPVSFWLQIRCGKLYFLEIPFDARLDFITSVYGCFKKNDLVSAVVRIQKKLGGLQTKNAVSFLLENNAKACFMILLKHYDKLYKKSFDKRENTACVSRVACESVTIENALRLL